MAKKLKKKHKNLFPLTREGRNKSHNRTHPSVCISPQSPNMRPSGRSCSQRRPKLHFIHIEANKQGTGTRAAGWRTKAGDQEGGATGWDVTGEGVSGAWNTCPHPCLPWALHSEGLRTVIYQRSPQDHLIH